MACGRGHVLKGSAMCDPDGILSREAADKVEELIEAIRLRAPAPLYSPNILFT